MFLWRRCDNGHVFGKKRRMASGGPNLKKENANCRFLMIAGVFGGLDFGKNDRMVRKRTRRRGPPNFKQSAKYGGVEKLWFDQVLRGTWDESSADSLAVYYQFVGCRSTSFQGGGGNPCPGN